MVERLVPVLPCRSLDDVVTFYAALGFAVTYRQQRPNPYVCLNRGELDLHFFGLADFDPEASLGNVLVLVPDAGTLFDDFAAGLRAQFGRLPIAGIPRITRPRRKQGTTGGFSVVDPGGNWLRVSSNGAASENDHAASAPAGVLERVLLNAARQGDARGDTAAAIAVLDTGLARHANASPAERLPALGYLAELLVRSGDRGRAAAVLAELDALPLDHEERLALAAELSAAQELATDLGLTLARLAP